LTDEYTPSDWIVCPECGSEEAVIIDWRPDPDTTLKCPDCGAIEMAEYYDDDAGEVY
jgi:uncharacterized Zn finger protein